MGCCLQFTPLVLKRRQPHFSNAVMVAVSYETGSRMPVERLLKITSLLVRVGAILEKKPKPKQSQQLELEMPKFYLGAVPIANALLKKSKK